jgi:crotonobetainyl-CoA:carnitine CoA-transferase CaiB-like acyl-CoA transferase
MDNTDTTPDNGDSATPPDDLPLRGIKVIEFAQMVAAPSAGLLLADYGADVINIEPPSGDSARQLRSKAAADLPTSPVFLAYNRGKRAIRLDLRDAGDCTIAERLLADADVLIESSRPGAMTRLGFGPEAAMASNPRLIYASVSGFGWGVTAHDKRGVDLIVQAESGIMSITGPVEVPMKVGFTVVDSASGHALCHAVLAALFRRERNGRGAHVRLSLYDLALHLQSATLVEYLMTGSLAPRYGNSAPLSSPADLLRCADGAIVVAAYLQAHWQILLQTISGEALADDQRFASPGARIENRQALIAALEALLSAHDAAEWERRLGAAGLLVGQVKNYAEVAQASYTLESKIIGRAGDAYGLHNPAQLSGITRGALRQRQDLPAADIDWLTTPVTGPSD